MIRLVRAIFNRAALLLAMSHTASAAPTFDDLPKSTPSQVSLTTLMKRLSDDSAFRARFSLAPAETLRENGIDPSPFDLPERLAVGDIDRFLANWRGPKGPALDRAGGRNVTIAGADGRPSLTAPVYGPPAGMRSKEDAPPIPPPSNDPSSKSEERPGDGSPTPLPPAPVYGPPPGLNR